MTETNGVLPSALLDADGPVAETIDGFKVRAEQQSLSDRVYECLMNDTVLTAEAGTGIGKSFAYLVPALISGKKVIVSTGTRHLQDQLFKSDLPRVMHALGLSLKTALLKGRANYLCLHRLELAPHLGFVSKSMQHDIQSVRDWAGITQTGDIAELHTVAEDSGVWPLVTSTTDNCLGSECDYWQKCHVVRARKEAQDAKLLVINHHLLLADMTLKQDGFAELLPGAEAFVIDEAHQLHDVASRFFGFTVSSRQLIGLSRDAIAEQLKDAPDMDAIRECADRLEKATRDFRLSLGEAGQKLPWRHIRHRPATTESLDCLAASLAALTAILEKASERSRGLEQCYQRSLGMQKALALFAVSKSDEAGPGEFDANAVLWFECWSKSFILHATPIDVAGLFRSHAGEFNVSWIFTSATLQVNREFSHFAQGLGIEEYESGVWESPFDYRSQSLLVLPDAMPEPSDRQYTRTLVERVKPLLEASRGRAFLLFTSYRAMHEAEQLLRDRIEYPVLVQGDLPRHRLLEAFRSHGNAVLLGTSSFWEGVDVRGEALSCVVIDKLPFASPGDPVMQARIDAIRRCGGNPFMDMQVPQAVISLKQGVGRLIRDVRDRGVVVIGDPRIAGKRYGRVFIDSLPAMPVTTDIGDAVDFFAKREDDEAVA